MLDGLLFYEVILMILGVGLFVFALVAGAYYVRHDKDLKAIAVLIALSIVMLGYPSIQKISISKDLVEIDKTTEEVAQGTNNNNEEAKQELRKTLDKVEGRKITNPTDALTIARGYKTVGDRDAALRVLDRSILENPNEPRLRQLRSQIGGN